MFVENLKKSSFGLFVIKIALLAFIVKIPAGILGVGIMNLLDLHNPMYSAVMQEPTLTAQDLILAILMAPILETVMGQALPIWFMSKWTARPFVLISVSASIFMVLHYPVIEFFPSAFAVGWIFAWAWVIQSQHNARVAFWSVALSHALHNALVAVSASLVMFWGK